ncbi:MAG: carbon starvation protein A [Halanaerobiaceae bacterium]
MSTSFILLIGIVIYLIAYFTYGKALSTKVVGADDSRITPAHSKGDGIDFVPAKPSVLFGHHFASIAGAAPILGPAMAIAWGWWAGLLWIWFGNIVIGAVHDYLAIMASVRYEGKSVQWIAGKMMKKRTSYMIQVFAYLALVLALAAFSTSLARLFMPNPDIASATFWFILAAVITGYLLFKVKINFVLGTIIGLILTALAIWLGVLFPLSLSYQAWMIVFFIYMMVASALPVWVLLQPRDYLNAYILVLGLIGGVIALLFAGTQMEVAGFTSWSATVVGGTPSPLWPVIPLVVACGSLSGIHALIGSGTTSKQLDRETQGLIVGYGGMLTEGLLSTVVTISIAGFGLMVLGDAAEQLAEAGIEYEKLKDPIYFAANYMKSINVVGGPLGIFARSYGQAIGKAFGISGRIGSIFSSLWVSAFVLTSMDTGARVARFAWEEVLEPLKEKTSGLHSVIANRWFGSALASGVSILLAWGGAYTILWPAFGGANQMLAAVTMLTVALWVYKVRKVEHKFMWAVVVPALALWFSVIAALVWYLTAVPATLIVRGFIVLEIVLALILGYDFYKSIKRKSISGGPDENIGI